MLLCVFPVMAQHKTKWDRLYPISHIGVATTAGLDLWTSHRMIGVPGVREVNFLFSTKDGVYNPRVAIPAKAGMHGGYYWIQHRETKRDPKLKKHLTIANFVLTGVLGYVAFNNYRVVNKAKNYQLQ